MRRRIAFQIRCLLLAALAATGAYAQSTPALPLLPNGVAYDAAGNLYFADTNRHQIYESSLAGVLTVVAGNGTQGFSGDGGPATSAQLNSPQGVAIGPDGTLYIADTGNQRIRAVSAGQITTLAGTGVAGFSGDNGQALAATFSNPGALAVDASGALLVCDTENQRIRRIVSGVVTTFAGSGVQGFAGDGAVATTAQLDTPTGIAVGADGRVYIADSHNNRVRTIALNGIISTFAGNGAPSYGGDNGPAMAAQLAMPQGLAATSTGLLLIADSNNQRIRMVDTQGLITTIVGSGVQGSSTDGTPATFGTLDTPRGTAISTFGSPVFADAGNSSVRESVGPGTLYLPAGLAPMRTSAALLMVPAISVYGQTVPVASVTGVVGTPQGEVQLMGTGGTTMLSQASLAAGAASFPATSVAAGSYSLTAAYLGDGVNPATTSPAVPVSVTAARVVATATPLTTEYGQAIPSLTGSLSGVLPQDAGDVMAIFATTATLLSAPGTYPITASLTGPASANYVLTLSPASGALQIDQAQSQTTEQALAQNSYDGLPLVLSASVISTTLGTPTGSVAFSDGGTLVGTVSLTDGTASTTYASPAAGRHSIVANYLGNADFAASTSTPVTTTIGAMPDFTITASGSATQTVASGGLANYLFLVAAQPAPFTGAVSLSAAGIPAGAVVSFSPTQTVPGAGSATVTMSLQTAAASATAQRNSPGGRLPAVCLLSGLMLFFIRRRSLLRIAGVLAVTAYCLGSVGCGARTVAVSALAQQTFVVTVTGSGTNLAGALVTHSATVTLVVQ